MGTDIHIKVEAKHNGAWNDVSDKAMPLRAKAYKIWDNHPDFEIISQEEKNKITREFFNQSPEGRNYTVFALLADVRNGFGFAGCEIFKPLKHFPLRGLPAEAYEEMEDSEWYNGGYHSFNHFTYEELIKSDLWEQPVNEKGYIQIDVFLKYLKAKETNPNTTPESYCGDSWGSGIEKIGSRDIRKKMFEGSLEQWIKEKEEQDIKVYVKHDWEDRTCLQDSAFYHWLKSDAMKNLVEESGGSDDVRIIVSFDS